MNIVEMYNLNFGNCRAISNDFSLIECETGIMIGVDKCSNVAIVLQSSSPKRFPIMQKTQNMSIECNMRVTYSLEGEEREGTVHIIRCLSSNPREKELFLELVSVMLANGDYSEEAIMDTFNMLRTFFNNKNEVSDNELIGLFAELYTIQTFHQSLKIANYWQSRDRMKFDFSFTDRLKLEVKATTKNTRVHHFRHEQLVTELFDIYVLSYMLRYDDEGLSLYDLMMNCKPLLCFDPRKLMKINTILKNVSEDRLKNMRFNREHLDSHAHFYRANDVPKFNESTPSGVANAEYDCVFENVTWIEREDFVSAVRSAVAEGISEE